MGVAKATNAIGIAGSLSSGLLEFLDTGSDTKTLHPGLASMNGILAAALAAAGGNGPATVLEGRRGVLATMSSRDSNPESIVSDLGSRWECTRISIKPIPACQLLHVTVDAAQQAPGPWQNITEIEAEVHPDSAGIVCEPREAKDHPKTPYDAKFSLPWTLAAQIIDGRVTLDTYSETGILRPEVSELAGRVRVVAGKGAGAAADAPGRVRITYVDGSTWQGTVSGSRGTVIRPLSDGELNEKFLMNCGDSRTALELRDAIWSLEDEASLDRLHDLATATAVEELRVA
jgi:2-methylcitrate dehydratase PrpD